MSTSKKTNPQSPVRVGRLVRQLLDEARDRKRRVSVRLYELRGDWIRYPVRGPMLPNGRPSPQWVIYQNAVRNHKRATDELAALLRLLPNRPSSPAAAESGRGAERKDMKNIKRQSGKLGRLLGAALLLGLCSCSDRQIPVKPPPKESAFVIESGPDYIGWSSRTWVVKHKETSQRFVYTERVAGGICMTPLKP